MSEAINITCPECGNEFPLSEALAHQIEDQARETERLAYEKKVADIKKAAAKAAEEKAATEISDLRTQIEEKELKLEEAQQLELSLRKRQRELEEKEKNQDLEIARRLDKERGEIRAAAKNEADEEHQLKDRQKDEHIKSMQTQIDELKRKAEQGSQEAQGEVLELVLEEMLKEAFPRDSIEPVSKGARGADVLHSVCGPNGQMCGNILFEAKNARNWSNGWIQKLKADQREARADVAVLVTSCMPNGARGIIKIDGAWVCDLKSAQGLAIALREGIIQVAQTRIAQVGKNDKKEAVYNYLSGPEFKQHVEAIVQPFITMQQDLETEKRSMQRLWKKREQQIRRVLESTAGMYGDLQGIIGASMPEIEQLGLPAVSGEADEMPELDEGDEVTI